MDESLCDYLRKFVGNGVLVHWNGMVFGLEDPLGNPVLGELTIVGNDFIVLTVGGGREVVIPIHSIFTFRLAAGWG